MKTRLLFLRLAPAVAAILLGGLAQAAPENLSLELTVIRFKPESKEQILQDFKFPAGSSNAVESLRKIGSSVDVLYRGTRDLAIYTNSLAKFDATETRPVLLMGAPSVPMPPATLYGLTLQVAHKGSTPNGIILGWEGTLTWSPELMDRRFGVQNSMQFIGKAAKVADSASKVAGDAQGTVKQAAEIGLAVAELFKGPSADQQIYELPVVKNFSLHGSRVCKPGQTIVTTTAAEAGVKEPQIIFFLLDVREGDR